jgi:dienelactone hydrolase
MVSCGWISRSPKPRLKLRGSVMDALARSQIRNYFIRVKRLIVRVICLALACPFLSAQVAQPFPAGTVIPKVSCANNEKESYALYLPSSFSAARRWPIIYVFDPGARGALAVERIRAAAEKFGYIVAASNNSRNGPTGGSAEAAQVMWQDTQQRFPVDEQRRYMAGMSGGARVAVSLALACQGCVAGVIANAAGFPANAVPPRDMKFAYFAAVGNADFNYAEFVELRRKLDEAGARYRIRIFEGQHGWAPPAVWQEALNWMDLEAMSRGILPRNAKRIRDSLDADLAMAREYQSKNNPLAAFRQYQFVVRDFANLADVSAAQSQLATLRKDKALKAAEKRESSDFDLQAHLTAAPSLQINAIATGDLSPVDFMKLRQKFAELKKDAARSRASKNKDKLVLQRSLGQLVVQAYEYGQRSLEAGNHSAALLYFDLVAVGSANPAWAHYQRARAYAAMSEKKNMLAELKRSLAGGFHDVSALDAAEFKAYRTQPDFQALVDEWKQKSQP